MKILSVIITTTLAILMLLWTKPETKAELRSLPVARVVATEVERRDIQPLTELTGKLQPARHAELRFELSGRIVQRFVEPGHRVEAGDTLLQIEDGDYRDRLAETQALMRQEQEAIARDRDLLELVRQERELQQREVERLKKLGQESLASQSNFDTAMQGVLKLKAEESSLSHAVQTASSRLQTKHAQLNRAERDVTRTRLQAPFAATVNAVTFEAGDYANAGQVAAKIVQLDELDLYLEVTSDMVRVLQLNQVVQVETENGQLQGWIIAIESDPQPDTLTHAIRIRLPGQDLFPGQLAVARLPGKSLNNVSVVPASAILYDEGRSYLFKIENEQLQRIPVKMQVRFEDLQSVTGIEAGSRIVARDVAALADGQLVSVDN